MHKEYECMGCGIYVKTLRRFKGDWLCYKCYKRKVHIIGNQTPDSDYYSLPPYYVSTIKIPIDWADAIEKRSQDIYKKQHTRARYIIALIRHDLMKSGLIRKPEAELVKKRQVGL
jgi:2',3'-cyclic-nucleotide 2'-phosphodiesterase (5'-nucleotidase family)